jgi:serine protease Do
MTAMLSLVPVALVLLALADPPEPADLVSALETAMADAIAKAEPSVVAIAREKNGDSEVTTAVRGQRNNQAPPAPPRTFAVDELGPDPQDWISFDYGSGVVVGNEGQILTAFHVVKGASLLKVRAAGRQQFNAEVIAADPRSDLAVIAPRISDGFVPVLKPIAIGDATKLRKGSFLLALGNPFNAARDGTASASWGILSNVSRRFAHPPYDEEEPYGPKQLRHYPTLLQLDSKLNLGMSGGAVVNLRGELVGITTAAAAVVGYDAQAGYAIPIDGQGRRILETLKQGKEVEYGFLGIGLDRSGSNKVDTTVPGTPAGEGGVQTGDVIVAVGELPVTDADSLVLAINRMPIGVPIKLRVLHQNKIQDRTVVLAKFPVRGEVIATNRAAPWRGLRVDYTSMLPNTTFASDVLNATAKSGVCVTDVTPGSPAAAAGLKKGLVITAVDDQRVHTPAEFAKAVADLKGSVNLVTDQGTKTVKPSGDAH